MKSASHRFRSHWYRSVLLFVSVGLCMFLIASEVFAAPRNGKIAFTSDRDGNQEIYVMNPDGSNQVRLTNNNVVDDHPTWSPDGTKIAFVSQRITGGFALYTMNADGSNKVEVTAITYSLEYVPQIYWSMNWSPDSTELAFQDQTDKGSYGIHIVRADGSGRRFLSNSFDGSLPAWSPDGSKIIFSRRFFSGPLSSRLFTIRPDDSGLQTFPSSTDYLDSMPAWSPSGEKIAFQEYDFANFEDLAISNADGTDRRTIASGCWNNPDGACGAVNSPVWSPDAKKIVYWHNAHGSPIRNRTILTVTTSGQNKTRLTTTESWNFNPSWQPLNVEISLSGRVTSANGRGIANTEVSITDSQGIRRTTMTSSFGYYSFTGVPGDTYTISVKSKRYQFEPSTVFAGSDMFNVDLVSTN